VCSSDLASPVPEKKTEESPAIAEPIPEKKIEEPPVIAEPVPEKKVEEPPVIAEPVPEEKIEEPTVIAEPVPEEKIEEPPAIAEPVSEKKIEEPPAIVEPIPEKKVEESPVIAELVPEKKTEEPPVIAEVTPPAKEFILTPTDEKPPENTIYGIDPSLIIPGIISAPPAKEPENLVLQPIISPVADDTFSVPSITQLDRGKYYVQVASYEKPESVEDTLKKIDPRYNPVVFKANGSVFRILLGPLNQGESAAILQRFKSIGYKNAFIRYEK
jgi:hypothetical protein